MEKSEIQEDVKTYKSLEAVANSDGGKILIDNLKKDVVNGVESLFSLYKNGSDIEIRTTIAKLQANLSLLRSLTRSSQNKKLAQEELKKLLEV
jgi:hypothetical protein